MIKVKEFLDENFIQEDYTSTAELKKNGHYNVCGIWRYKENTLYIRCRCNNETLCVDVIRNDDGVFQNGGIYSYFQTYRHIPRGQPDKNGYYLRSTDEEIIRYIKSYMKPFLREEKLNKILE
jgi:hypothetical protein